MIKKLILLFTVFMIVFIIYLIYDKATRSTIAPNVKDQRIPGQKLKTIKSTNALITDQGTGLINAKDIRIISINEETGKTEQIFALKKRDTSSTKHAIVINPWIKQFDHANKKIMTFRADRLITSIENQQAIPKEGILEGNVQIHLFSLDQDQSIDRFVPNETEMSITTSRIEYLQEFNKITVPHQVKISTPSFNAQGNYFTIKYDGNKKVVEHFEFRSIDYFKISNNTSSATNKDKDKNNDEGQDIDFNTTPLFYRITLSDNVEIAQSQNNQTVYADKINLLIDRNYKFNSESNKRENESPPREVKEKQKEPQKVQTPNITTLNCKGPLNVTVLKKTDITPDMSPLSFEITGKPMIIVKQNDIKIASLPKITYDIVSKTNGKATIYSPANILVNSFQLNNNDSIKVVLLDQDIDLNINHYLNSNHIESVDFRGNIDISRGKSTSDIDLQNIFIKTAKLRSNKGTFKFGDSDTMPIQSVELLNRIEINNNDITDNQNPFDFRADSVNISFEEQNGEQVMSAFTATGNVFYEDPNIMIETDDFLQVVMLQSPESLSRRDKPSTTVTNKAKVHFKATSQSKHNKLRIKIKEHNKTLTGNLLTGDTISNKWHIDGTPAYVIDHNNDNNQIAYEQLTFELDNTNTAMNIDNINVDGPGTIAMQLKAHKSKLPTEILVSWLDHIIYQSKPYESMQMQDATIDRTTYDEKTMTERTVTIKSPIITMSTTKSKPDKVSITKPKNELFDFQIEKISTSGGEVLIYSESINTQKNILIDAFELTTQNIDYSADENILISKGPGNYLYFNYHPNYQKNKTTKVSSKNGLKRSENSSKPFSTIIYFENRMIYDPNKSEVCFEGDIKLLYTLFKEGQLDFTSGFELFADALIISGGSNTSSKAPEQATELYATNVFFKFKKGETEHNIQSDQFSFNTETGVAIFSGDRKNVILDGNRYSKIEITDIESKSFKAYPLGMHEFSTQ